LFKKDKKDFKNLFVVNVFISPFNTQTMHIKSFCTQQHCYVSLKALYPGGIQTGVFSFLRRMRCPLRHAALGQGKIKGLFKKRPKAVHIHIQHIQFINEMKDLVQFFVASRVAFTQMVFVEQSSTKECSCQPSLPNLEMNANIKESM
jgi:hypothetical protein